MAFTVRTKNIDSNPPLYDNADNLIISVLFSCMISNAQTKHVRAVQFGLVSPDFIQRNSVVSVTESQFYKNGAPKPGGCNDLRMGTTDRDFVCATCKKDAIECPGHFGHIDFHVPVMNPNQIKTIFKVLRCICFYCSRLLIDSARCPHKNNRKKKVLMHVSNICKHIRTCPYCKGNQPDYVLKVYEITHRFSQPESAFASRDEYQNSIRPLTASSIRDKFASMVDEDILKIGMCPKRSRPEWLIWTCMLVPPPCIRPSVVISAGSQSRGHDFLTIKLQEIVKANRKIGTLLAKNPGANTKLLEEELQSQIAMYLDKDINISRRSRGKNMRGDRRNRRNNVTRSLTGRISGKKGRIRHNICGKRTNLSSRTVITADSTMDIDQLGVPKKIALHQTLPVRVNRINQAAMLRRVRNGSGRLDGALKIETLDGRCINLDYCTQEKRNKLKLPIGTIVHRFLNDGDWVVFNRQPTLHKGSMMGHRIKVVDGLTFLLPVPDTTPFNADFDGDEMNMHVPQDEESKAETQMIGIENNMIDSKIGLPNIACVQDTVIGLYLMCRPGCFVPPETFYSLSMHCRYCEASKIAQPPAILKPKRMYTGYQLASLTIPCGVSVNHSAPGEAAMDDRANNRMLRVVDGEALCGSMTKKVSGRTGGGLVHVVCQDMGKKRGMQMVSDMQRLATRWLCLRGCSVGVTDCRGPDKLNRSCLDMALQKRVCRANRLFSKGKSTRALEIMQGALMACGTVVSKTMSNNNMLGSLVTSGSKGSIVNLAQVMGCVGQQTNTEIQHCDRRTSYRKTNDRLTAMHNGFCQSSFYKGLHPVEFFHHTVSGRSGLIDTAVKTAKIGYVQRRLIKAMEPVKVGYDMRVFKIGRFLQQRFGGNGLSCEKLRAVSVDELTMPINLVVKKHGNVEGRCIVKLRDRINRNRQVFVDHNDTCASGKLWSPLDILTLRKQFVDRDKPFGDTFQSHRKKITALMQRLYSLLGGKYNAAVVEFVLLTGFSFRERKKHNIGAGVYPAIERQVYGSMYNPGESIGTLSACCISQPITQMTLNTFHFAGLDAKCVNQGVPRFNEFMDATKKIKTPFCTARTVAPHSRGLDAILKRETPMQLLQDLVRSVHIRCETLAPVPEDEEKARLVHTMYLTLRAKATAPKSKIMKNKPLPPIPYEPYSVVFELVHNSDLLEVASFLSCKLGGKFNIIPVHPSAQNKHQAKVVVFTLPQKRIKVCPSGCDKNVVFQTVADFCMKLVVRGVEGVKRVYSENGLISFHTTKILPVAAVSVIDPLTCTSNDVHAVLEVLGVEAALITLYTEMQKVIQFDGNCIHWKYVYLLAENILHRGYMCPITRHGMGRKQNGVLIRASFETTKEVFLEGATHALNDPMHGVTPNIIFANRIPSGTGTFDVLALPNTDPKSPPPKEESHAPRCPAPWNYLKNVHRTMLRGFAVSNQPQQPIHPPKLPNLDKVMIVERKNETPTEAPKSNHEASSEGDSPVYRPDSFSDVFGSDSASPYCPYSDSDSPAYCPDGSPKNEEMVSDVESDGSLAPPEVSDYELSDDTSDAESVYKKPRLPPYQRAAEHVPDHNSTIPTETSDTSEVVSDDNVFEPTDHIRIPASPDPSTKRRKKRKRKDFDHIDDLQKKQAKYEKHKKIRSAVETLDLPHLDTQCLSSPDTASSFSSETFRAPAGFFLQSPVYKKNFPNLNPSNAFRGLTVESILQHDTTPTFSLKSPKYKA